MHWLPLGFVPRFPSFSQFSKFQWHGGAGGTKLNSEHFSCPVGMCFSYHRAWLMDRGLVVLMSSKLVSLFLQAMVRTVCLRHPSSNRDDKEPQKSSDLSLAVRPHLIVLISSLSYHPLPSTLPFPGDRREDTPLSSHRFLPHHCFFGAALEPKRCPFTSETIVFLWFMICLKD